MKKIETKLEYINLACSKDSFRPSLNCAYREKDRLVATNGHLLIMQSDLNIVESGHYLDYREEQFPDITPILDTVKDCKKVCTINSFLNKDFKELVKPLELMTKLKNDKNFSCDLLAKDNKLTFTLSKNTTVFKHEIDTNTEHEIDIKINLEPFITLLHIGLLEREFDLCYDDDMLIVKSSDLIGVLMTLRKS